MKKRPKLNKHKAEQRLEWAKEHELQNIWDWKGVI